jgi:rod shape-determining protein MreC
MRLVWWLATILGVGFASILLSEVGAIDPARNLTLTVSAPVEDVLHNVASPLDDIYQGITDRGDLVRQNDDLRRQVEALQAQVAAQLNLEQQLQDLQAAVGVKQDRPDDQLLAANVIAEEPSNLKRLVAIDRGSGDGLDEGMVVLSRSGSLVGTITAVYGDYSWIRLVTDPESAVNAQVNIVAPTPGPSATPAPSATPSTEPPGAVRGVAEGDLREKIMLDLLPPNVNIAQGSLVVTSGLGGNYPPGILIGSVKDVEQRPASAFKRASIEPATDLSSLETVLVLVNFRPARLVAP